MQIDPYILAFAAITVIVTIWMGFRSAKQSKTASDFFVAGRSVGVGMNASAISGEYLSAASFMGVAGMVMSSGYDALWYPVCYACGYLFLLLFIAGPLRRFGAYTIPDFAEGRFDSPVFRKIAVVFVLFIGFFYTMPQMKGAGTTLAYIFPGLPYWAGVVLVGAVITLNVALGGMKGITLVQAFQYWAKMFAISVPIFVLMAVYGHYGKQVGANHRSAGSATTLDDNYDFSPVRTNSTWAGKSFGHILGSIKADPAEQPKVEPRYTNGLPGIIATDDVPLRHVLQLYERAFGGRTLVADDAVDAGITFKEFTTNYSSPEAAFAAGLAKNGIALIDSKERIVFAVPATAEPLARRYLAAAGLNIISTLPRPAKAPADATWLNPFGPLTTKAAKAAAVAIGKSSEANTNGQFNLTNGSVLYTVSSNNLDASLDFSDEALSVAIKSGLLPVDSTTFNSLTVKDAARLYGRLRLGTTTPYTICVARNVESNRLNLSASGRMLVSGYLDLVRGALRTNGLTLTEDRRDFFRIFPTAQAAQYNAPELFTNGASESRTTVETAWLAKHEKPLALLYTYSLIIALVCGTAGLPHILVRFYTNPDGVAAKRTTMWVMILIGVFYVFPPVFGVLGRNLMPDLYNGLTGVKGTDGIVLRLPVILRERYGALGSILSGVTCAGAFAAFMSTFSGLLVSMTGALAHDVYGRMLRPKSTPEQRLRAFKTAAVLIGGVAIVLGCFVEPLEINFMVGQAFAIAAASYFPLLFMSVWWRGMTMRGAATGMLAGGLCALAAVALTNVSNLALDKGPMGKVFAGFAPLNEFWAAHPLLRILCEQPAIWTVPLAIGLMVVVSKLTAQAVPADIRMKMLVLHAPEKLGLKQEYIQEHQHGH